ncbi:MAG: DUF559 domain-containing protein [Proteobacteria bacterium]|nr:DUF559 domain-containing protein [Pseudomonadota bacterium]
MKREFARNLRQDATDAECKLWRSLRGKELGGFRFRRQQPIGPYVVDFFCSAAKLIIELDGGQHGEDRNVSYDAARTRWLEARGYRVLRFANSEFLRQPGIVLNYISHVVAEREIPYPPSP